jgi:hypothetical protein
MLYNVCKAGVDCLTTSMSGSEEQRRQSYRDVIASILTFIIAIVIIGFVGKFIWNETMPELFSFVRPVKSCWQVIGLIILVSLFR